MFAQVPRRLTCRKRRWPTLDKSVQVLRSWSQSILWQLEHWDLEQLGATNARVHVGHTIDNQFDWDIWPKISCLKSKTFWPELRKHASFDFGEEKMMWRADDREEASSASGLRRLLRNDKGQCGLLFGLVPHPITSFHFVQIHSKAISFYRVEPK